MESSKETFIVPDTVGDNIFQWNVKLSEFSDTALDQDLRHLLVDFDHDYIELQLDFSMDLYPFLAPLVKVIRPRLQGSMMLRVTTMEILKLAYCIKVVKCDSETSEVIDPVKFVEIVTIKDFETIATPLDPFDMMIVNFKNAHPDFCLELINKLIRSDKIMHAALMIFELETQQFENLSCLRSNSFGDMERFKIVPVYFNNFKQKLGDKGRFLENMSYGILFGRFSVLIPPLKRAYRNLDNLPEIVTSICPPEAKVALVTDSGIPLIKIHTSDLSYQVVYFGTRDSISKFQKKLSKDKTSSSHINSPTENIDPESESESGGETEPFINQENQPEVSTSLTSPIKYTGHNVSQDSGIGSPELNKACCSFERKMSEQDPDTPIERKKVDASAKAILEVEPTAPTVEVDQERYRHFIKLLHKCSSERNQAQSLEIELIRTFFAEAEKKSPFNNADIDAFIDKMAGENKVMRSDNIVFII